MRAARDPDEFAADPRGLYLAGHSFVLWVLDETLAGSVYFGRPDARDFPTLLRFGQMGFHAALRAPFDAVIDCSAVRELDASAFEVLAAHLGSIEGLAARVRRAAIVRPAGVVGATLAGLFYEQVRPAFSAALFTDAVEAYRWLGRADGEREQRAVQEALAQAHETPDTVRRLREYLPGALAEPSLAETARALALSERSLQRRLHEAGTSFRAEVERARVRAAELLLLDGEMKLEAIARQVGCASSSHFAQLFRRTTGELPNDFRKRRLAVAPR
jgi:AraC-like DNA-binding protein